MVKDETGLRKSQLVHRCEQVVIEFLYLSFRCLLLIMSIRNAYRDTQFCAEDTRVPCRLATPDIQLAERGLTSFARHRPHWESKLRGTAEIVRTRLGVE